MIKAYAAHEPGGQLQPFEYDPGTLGDEEVEIKVEYCGICHSDLSMLDNEWGMTEYPFVPGHEVVGTIAALGDKVTTLNLGQRVGLGWFSGSCMTCEWCMSGNHNLCSNAEGTIVSRHGGFADKVRADYSWVVPLPDGINPATAGPLFCGGITVFNPIVQFDIKPSDRVGVIGIGGLGHIALGFLQAWGCEITAFSSSPDKEAEARELGATHFINSGDPKALESVQNSFDFILSTASADLDWNAYIAALRPKGRLHFVGVIPNPLSTPIFPLIAGQKSISASPLGSPVTITRMLDFAARQGVEPITETFSFEQVNEAMEKLRHGKPRYRLVLKHS
ncbi:MAG: NAD(P)-dependent alcohol dehydrogenase [Coleofasciculus sp. A1-SPW-01]|uniref:NADPH-dependent aldehyde reductase Ahr n=1 Tax=Coleofasciculus sp. A1-SPW-01 TaxID=3070819 RepID=UPI0032F53B5F